jgi:glucuronokinase
LTDLFRQALDQRDTQELGSLIDANFDLRHSICKIAPGQLKMVELAREAGASAKFAGSGGTIIGTYQDASGYERLKERLGSLGCRVIRPIYVPSLA